MKTLATRLIALEQKYLERGVFLVYVGDDGPTPEQQADIDRAKAAGRPVFVLDPIDAAI